MVLRFAREYSLWRLFSGIGVKSHLPKKYQSVVLDKSLLKLLAGQFMSWIIEKSEVSSVIKSGFHNKLSGKLWMYIKNSNGMVRSWALGGDLC